MIEIRWEKLVMVSPVELSQDACEAHDLSVEKCNVLQKSPSNGMPRTAVKSLHSMDLRRNGSTATFSRLVFLTISVVKNVDLSTIEC